MNPIRYLLALVLMASLAACATADKDMQAVGGSRSQGIVYLTYEYHFLSDPEPDQAAGRATARERCVGWGYSDAQPFNNATRRCRDRLCWVYVVTVPYQCTGPRR